MDATVIESLTGSSNRTLLDVIPMLWQEECKHAVVKGDGGMGKTVSLVRLWDVLTNDYDANRPVPVFIQLNEINMVPEAERMDFIISAIREEYFDAGVIDEEIMRLLREPRDIPAVILLLDGFNEVTVDNSALLIQIRKLMEQARGVQLVITSRYDMRKPYGWGHLHLLELQGLEEKQVREYLEKKKSKIPNSDLLRLLHNPMMLTLYTSTCEVRGKYEGDFKAKVDTAGELLWDFIETQIAVMLERLNYNKKKWWFYKFLLKFILPAVGYEMEKAGLFAFERGTLNGILDFYCSRFSQDDFFETFVDYNEFEEALPTSECGDKTESRKRRSEILNILCKVLLMMVKEGETYRFLHQDFRDYFAALHILQEVEMGLKRGEVADVLKQQSLPVYIRRFIAELEEEHDQRPVLHTGKGWQKNEVKTSLLNCILDLCRGVFDGSVGFGPWNIIEVWKEARGELSGVELSDLDLSRVLLNGTHCSRFFKNDFLAANFDGSLLNEVNLFPLGHTSYINSAAYSVDGKKILSASTDKTIKEWDVASGQCLKTFTGHDESVTSALYSNDGKKILSASSGKTIKTWNAKKGQCIETYKGNFKAEENPGGANEKLRTPVNKIEILDDNTGEPVRTFTNIPGLFIQGCSFKNLHPDSDLSEESKKLMRQYGAVMDGEE